MKVIFPKYSLLSFTIFFDLEKIIFENFNISENNIISVELAKGITKLQQIAKLPLNKLYRPII